jgi:hypothetical protein
VIADGEQQILFGNDRKKSMSNGKNRTGICDFPPSSPIMGDEGKAPESSDLF